MGRSLNTYFFKTNDQHPSLLDPSSFTFEKFWAYVNTQASRAGREIINREIVLNHSIHMTHSDKILFATPIEWDELDEEVSSSDYFNIFTILDRLKEKWDIGSDLNDYACSFKNADKIIQKTLVQ